MIFHSVNFRILQTKLSRQQNKIKSLLKSTYNKNTSFARKLFYLCVTVASLPFLIHHVQRCFYCRNLPFLLKFDIHKVQYSTFVLNFKHCHHYFCFEFLAHVQSTQPRQLICAMFYTSHVICGYQCLSFHRPGIMPNFTFHCTRPSFSNIPAFQNLIQIIPSFHFTAALMR